MTPTERLEALFESRLYHTAGAVSSDATRTRIARMVRAGYRAGSRLVMACLLAKLDRPEVDPRKPDPEAGPPDSFDGRWYDECHLGPFLVRHRLPHQPRSAFLDPGYTTVNRPLTTGLDPPNRPQLHDPARAILNAVATGLETAAGVLIYFFRELIALRDEQTRQLEIMLADRPQYADMPPSAEAIVSFVGQCMAFHNHRLVVLVVVAAYSSVREEVGVTVRPLAAHNAADEQTGAVGDVEISLVSDARVRTVYEMKRKAVTRDDIDRALQKVAGDAHPPDNYVFVTTEPVERVVRDYAASLYAGTGGVEFAVLDCVGFLRHFLHLFHRHRTAFLDAYEALVLAEPDSAVGFELKQAFLALRSAATPPPAGQ